MNRMKRVRGRERQLDGERDEEKKGWRVGNETRRGKKI